MDDFEILSDHFILRMYGFIRNEVQADVLAGTHLVGLPARQRVDRLCKSCTGRMIAACRPLSPLGGLSSPR